MNGGNNLFLTVSKIGVVVSVLLLSGCDFIDNNLEKNDNSVKGTESNISDDIFSGYSLVDVVQSERNTIIPEITLTGTITTKNEITIASEVTGTVQKVAKEEGDRIVSGQTLLLLESRTNLLRASYSSAALALSNAKRSLSLAKKSAKQNQKDSDLGIKNAEIALNNSEIAYKRIKRSQKFKYSSNTATKESSDKILEITEKNLEIAKKSLVDIFVISEQTNIRYLDSISSLVSSTFIELRSNLDFLDSLIGASEFKKNDNDSFEVYLAGSSANLIHEIQSDWRLFTASLNLLDGDFLLLKKLQYDISDEEELLRILSLALEKIQEMDIILKKMEIMLSSSISSSTFPESKITELKGKITQLQSSLEGRGKSLKDLRQSIADFKIQNTKNISDAELAIAIRESEVLAQKSQNLVVENSEGVTSISIDSELESAKNAYLNAKNAVAFAKSQKVSVSIQGDLAIQSALAQLDASQSMVDQAALGLSKLTISSGISGTVSKVLAFPGDTVSPGTPLLIISDYSELKLVSDVSLEESFLLHKGMEAEVVIDGVAKVFLGKVSIIYPEADKITRRVRLEILIPNKDKIPANVFATAKIKLQRQKPEVYIKSELLISQNPASIMIAEKKHCKKNEELCESMYNNKQIFIVRKRELKLKNTEETEFGFIVERGLRPNEFIISNKLKTLFEGDEILLNIKE